jgi:hypothetical protein
MQPPLVDIDPRAFWSDPYPDLARLRAERPWRGFPRSAARCF